LTIVKLLFETSVKYSSVTKNIPSADPPENQPITSRLKGIMILPENMYLCSQKN